MLTCTYNLPENYKISNNGKLLNIVKLQKEASSSNRKSNAIKRKSKNAKSVFIRHAVFIT